MGFALYQRKDGAKMETIAQMKLKLAELYQELHELESAEPNLDNLKRVKEIESTANAIRMAIRHTKQKLGLHVA